MGGYWQSGPCKLQITKWVHSFGRKLTLEINTSLSIIRQTLIDPGILISLVDAAHQTYAGCCPYCSRHSSYGCRLIRFILCVALANNQLHHFVNQFYIVAQLAVLLSLYSNSFVWATSRTFLPLMPSRNKNVKPNPLQRGSACLCCRQVDVISTQ